MAVRCVIVPPCIQESVSVGVSIEWDRCVMCQLETNEKLVCPANSKRTDPLAGYQSFAEILPLFAEANLLKPGFKIDRLDNGSGIVETLCVNNAKWHKSCRLYYYQTRLDRAAKRSFESTLADEGESSAGVSDESHANVKRVLYRRWMSTDFRKSAVYKQPICFLCDDPCSTLPLHQACTDDVDLHVKAYAKILCDASLLAKVSDSDLSSQEAKYHKKCLTDLCNDVRAFERRKRRDAIGAHNETEFFHGIVFAQLIAHIEETRADSSIVPIFKLADLVKLYTVRLSQLALSKPVEGVHSTRLKDKLLTHFPKMRAQQEGRDVLLIFESDIGPALKKACQYDCDQDAVYLAKASEIVRRNMFGTAESFDGSFSEGCQERVVAPNLLALVNMILQGPSITAQSQQVATPAALTISQLLISHSVKHRRLVTNSAATDCRRSHAQETPLPLYVSLLLHATTRKRTLIDRLFHLGLCVSYERVLDVTAELANGVCDQFHADHLVCPLKLRSNIFTVAAVDNIDHNPTATTAHGSFHGTGISLMQQPDVSSSGTQRSILYSNIPRGARKIKPLPDSYSEVLPVRLKTDQPALPASSGPFKGDCVVLTDAIAEEHEWLDTVKQLFDAEVLDESTGWVSWSAFHASRVTCPDIASNLAIISMLPLFQESSNSVAMIRHSMNLVQTAVQHLNPMQIPIIAFDQPLYAIAKCIQWNWPDIYGEDKFCVMMGGLHIEMATLKALGSLLKGSGWVEVISTAGIATPGTAESLLSASHVRRCRHVHEITVSALHILQYRAYESYCKAQEGSTQSTESFVSWCEQQMAHPQFAYWAMIKDIELSLLAFVRSLRTSNFQLYVDSLTNIVPWFFSLDRTHYARWLSVHIKDMASLSVTSQSTYMNFMNGKFTVKKTVRNFSAMAIDQCHEQSNATVKGDGGIIGLTEDEHALRRWMVSGPEVARVIKEFQDIQMVHSATLKHHQQAPGVQAAFKKDVNTLVETLIEFGNPFEDCCNELVVLHSRHVVDCTKDEVASVREVGRAQYGDFVKERLFDRSVSIYAPLKRNNLALFKSPRSPRLTKSSQRLQGIRNDCSLFSRLYIGCQSRSGNLDTFFEHENQAYPPSISEFGTLRFGSKSDLLSCLEKVAPTSDSGTGLPPLIDMIALDGAVIVQLLRPGKSKTFADYANDVFLPYIQSQIAKVRRLDLVWDTYLPFSLKASTRAKRGTGVRVHVGPQVPIPSNWQEFLRDDQNKSELFKFLSECTVCLTLPESKCILATSGQSVLFSGSHLEFESLQPCSHEEADTRLVLHAANAAKAGYKNIAIRTVDTDVLVIAISVWQEIECDELWLAFGTGKYFRYIAVHELANSLGPEKSKALPAFHSLTGCDTTSSFCGKGKKTAWLTWSKYPDATAAFSNLMTTPDFISNDTMQVIERFIIMLYDRTAEHSSVNSARQFFFTQKGWQISNIPPTRDALIQHVKRAAYQSGHVWSQTLVVEPALPCPSEWGWYLEDSNWLPRWMTLPEADKCCPELLKCGCKSGCITRRCKCVRANLKCTGLCSCEGECIRD
jgi:hypothetical protein